MKTNCHDNTLKLKADLISNKNKGVIFYKESISKLPLDEPFEFYYNVTNGTITYQNAFPVPVKYFKPWIKSEDKLQHLLPYYQSYYGTDHTPGNQYFQNLSYFKGERFVWFYEH